MTEGYRAAVKKHLRIHNISAGSLWMAVEYIMIIYVFFPFILLVGKEIKLKKVLF